MLAQPGRGRQQRRYSWTRAEPDGSGPAGQTRRGLRAVGGVGREELDTLRRRYSVDQRGQRGVVGDRWRVARGGTRGCGQRPCSPLSAMACETYSLRGVGVPTNWSPTGMIGGNADQQVWNDGRRCPWSARSTSDSDFIIQRLLMKGALRRGCSGHCLPLGDLAARRHAGRGGLTSHINHHVTNAGTRWSAVSCRRPARDVVPPPRWWRAFGLLCVGVVYDGTLSVALLTESIQRPLQFGPGCAVDFDDLQKTGYE